MWFGSGFRFRVGGGEASRTGGGPGSGGNTAIGGNAAEATGGSGPVSSGGAPAATGSGGQGTAGETATGTGGTGSGGMGGLAAAGRGGARSGGRSGTGGAAGSPGAGSGGPTARPGGFTHQQAVLWNSGLDAARMKRFLDTIQWWRMRPDMTGAFITEGNANACALDHAVGALADDDSFGVVYTPTARTLTLKMPGSRNYMLRWFDPSNGLYRTGSVAGAAGASVVMTHPGNNASGSADWVIHVSGSRSLSRRLNRKETRSAECSRLQQPMVNASPSRRR